MNHALLFALRLIFVSGLLLATQAVAGEGQDAQAGRLSVMTQNLYVGADLFKIIAVGNPGQVPQAVAEVFGDIQATDFAQRAAAIADIVARNRPHLIGLQEVSKVRTQCPGDILTGTLEPNATDVYADYLQILLDAFAARGLDYKVAAQVENADVELPAANLGLLTDCAEPVFDARLTDYDVTLARADVETSPVADENYLANAPIPTAAGSIEFTRGFTVVDADVHGRAYRFANTHLEVSGDPFVHFFQWAQAEELAQTLEFLTLLAGDRIVVAVGDFNSDPMDTNPAACLLPPLFKDLGECPTPYATMSNAGFMDTWLLRNGKPDDGYTCCQEDLLTNDDSWLDQRIDHVWVHEPYGGAAGPHFLNAVHAETVGDRQKDRSSDGLWPSDHAGVVVDMTFRQEK